MGINKYLEADLKAKPFINGSILGSILGVMTFLAMSFWSGLQYMELFSVEQAPDLRGKCLGFHNSPAIIASEGTSCLADQYCSMPGLPLSKTIDVFSLREACIACFRAMDDSLPIGLRLITI